ncbi:MAG: flavin reductase family protein [Acidobacteriaceae bacterium]|nr:flavin reductase family protein [Acidobacteriaceae bacterium]
MNTDLNASQVVSAGDVSAAEFRSICGSFPSGVTVITRRLANGLPYGMTVSSFTSVSLHPPLILVCVDKDAGFLEAMEPGLPFIVNVLSEDQQHLAKRFSDRGEEDRFAGVDWTPGWANVPLLGGTVASFGCSLDRIVEAGDHLVLIAAVRELQRHQGRPLVWCDRAYHLLPRPR